MAKSISVKIYGKKYNLIGEDEESAHIAAGIVTKEIEALREKHKDTLPHQTLYILAALNIAQRDMKMKRKAEEEIDFLKSELSRIKDFLSHNINA